jgi:hypothetical protein
MAGQLDGEGQTEGWPISDSEDLQSIAKTREHIIAVNAVTEIGAINCKDGKVSVVFSIASLKHGGIRGRFRL